MPLSNKAVHRIFFAATGFAVGALPLAAVNFHSFLHSGRFVSLSDVQQVHRSAEALFRFVGAFVSLGSGAGAREFILGDGTALPVRLLEGVALVGLVTLSLVATDRTNDRQAVGRFAQQCALAYVLIGLAIWLLPAETDVHHWLLATPYQYIAIALSSAGFFATQWKSRWRAAAFSLLLAGLLVNRAFSLASTVRDLAQGRYSSRFDPSLTRLGEFVRKSPREAAFIAADWGVSATMFCLSNGPRDRVFEPYWFYTGPESIEPIFRVPGKDVFYVVTLKPVSGVRPEQTRHLLADVVSRRDLVEAPPDPALASLAAVDVRRFVRTSPRLRF